MASAFTRDYTDYNPDASTGPDTWILNSAGAHPGGSGGGSTDTFTADIPIVQSTSGTGARTITTAFDILTLTEI